MTATALWPSDLPSMPRAAGFGYTEGDNTIRSEMDVGPAKVRRRSTLRIDRYSVSLSLDDDQRVSLYQFRSAILEDGSLSFTWTHPITGMPCECRFVGPIAWARESGEWVAAFEVEVIA